jgi:hypothetical protein
MSKGVKSLIYFLVNNVDSFSLEEEGKELIRQKIKNIDMDNIIDVKIIIDDINNYSKYILSNFLL